MNDGPHCAHFLYLHGFASGPDSSKGRAVAGHFAARGVEVKRLDLRRPSMEHLRLSAMIAHVTAEIGGPRDRAVLFGSSLGGLTAARVAERDPRVAALVLLAPAFRMIDRWRQRIGEEAWKEWERGGWHETKDWAKGGMARVDFGFAEDVAAVDGPANGTEAWPDVRVPTLIVHGIGDDVVPIEHSRAWALGKPHVRLVEVRDGHELGASIDLINRLSVEHLRGFVGGEVDA